MNWPGRAARDTSVSIPDRSARLRHDYIYSHHNYWRFRPELVLPARGESQPGLICRFGDAVALPEFGKVAY